MGVVWLARDEKLDRPVALKFLPETLFMDAASRDELKRETRRSLELTHPNVVRIYDFVEDDEAAAISMEYVDGESLSSLRVARQHRCFEAEGLAGWVTDLCRALDYAHSSALVIHRDLKPSNLMVSAGGILKVTDFGISCSLQNTAARVSAWASSGGTLGYMSPQQLRGDLAAPSDDIYAVGASLYELLTSKPPFYSGDLSLQIRTVEPETMTVRRQQLGVVGEPIPARWEETVAACLAKNPAQRPASAADLAERLGLGLMVSWRSQESPEMMTVRSQPGSAESGPTRLWAWLSRGKRPTVLAAALAGTALLAAFLMMSSPRRPATAAPAHAGVAPPDSTPSPSGRPGGIMIKTDPPGALVTAGTKTAVSPAAIGDLAPGATLLRVELDGFEPEILPAEVRANEFTNLGVIVLRRSSGTLELLSEPQDAAYTLLSEKGDAVIREGFTPDTVSKLPTGSYRVRFERRGWPAEEQVLTVERQTTSTAERRFGEGELQVTTDPPGAEIALGSQVLGRTPLSVRLPSGPHGPFIASLEGWEPSTFDAAVRHDAAVALPPIALRPASPKLAISTHPPGIPFRLFSGAVESPNSAAVRASGSPSTLEGLAPGPYRVVFDAAPWPSRSSALEMAGRGITRFHQSFPHGTVKVESLPPGAEVFIGEASIGETPLEIPLPPGPHSLVAELRGRAARPKVVSVVENQEQVVRFDFRGNESAAPRKPTRPRKREEESGLTKISRSIKTFFSGDKAKR